MGVFDGVHKGHRQIISKVVKRANVCRTASLLVTFWPHPANVLKPYKKVPLLISLKHRLSLIDGLGVDYALVLRFTKKLSRMNASEFIKQLIKKIHIGEIVVGGNFFFGRNKSGSLEDLRAFSNIYGYKINSVKPRKAFGKIISSTRIRELILRGNLVRASRLLSKPVAILGTVVSGERRGRFMGFPTANIDPHHEAIPPSGVYAVKVRFGKKLHKGILNIGTRPTFKRAAYAGQDPTIEVNIFNFNKSIYGDDLEIMFVKKLRIEKKFRDLAALRRQIEKDRGRAKKILQ